MLKIIIRSVKRVRGKMEYPGSWNLLTASLAATDLQQPFASWAFLVIQGLVRDTPGDREAFTEFVREEMARGPITGPSLALRVAGALDQAGIALLAGRIPDPHAAVAAERLALVAQWSGSILGHKQLEDLERFPTNRTALAREECKLRQMKSQGG
jgi:hypothetical protein